MKTTIDQYQSFSTHWRHDHIIFDEKSHRYYFVDWQTGKKETWTGVTTLIKKYQVEPDWKSIAHGVARKRRKEGEQITAEEVLAEWKEKGNETADRGQQIHDAIEIYIKEKRVTPGFENFIEKFKFYMELYDLTPMDAEVVVYDEKIKTASMIDILCVRENKLVVVDTKTMEKEIDHRGYKGRQMLYPFHALQDCRYSKFSIQVGLYQRWLKRKYLADVDPVGYIFHINDTMANLVPTLDVQKQIEEMYLSLPGAGEETPPWE